MSGSNKDPFSGAEDSYSDPDINIKTVLLMMKLVQRSTMKADVIDLKFLVSGHSYLPNDSDFDVIETKARKTQNIFSQEDGYNIIRPANQKTILY